MTILELREKRAKSFLYSHHTDKGILSSGDDATYSHME